MHGHDFNNANLMSEQKFLKPVVNLHHPLPIRWYSFLYKNLRLSEILFQFV